MSKSQYLLNFLFVVLYLTQFHRETRSCSPPRSKFGENTIKEESILKRSNKAEIVVLGSVVETHPDKYGQSVTVRIAVHMVLKAKSKVKKYITINGFDSDPKDVKNKFFASQASVDCVNSVVELYGSYIFFVRESKYGDYYTDEVNLQSAVTEIPCREQLSKRVKRLIIKYRKEKNNQAQCNDFAHSSSNYTRKCLKHRSFSRLLNEFKYKQLPIRKFFCSVRRAESFKKLFPTETAMRDDVSSRRYNKNKRMENTDKEHNTRTDENDRIKTTEKTNRQEENFQPNSNINNNNGGGNIIVYSKSENFIVRQNGVGGSNDVGENVKDGISSSNQQSFNINIPDWRFFQHHQTKTVASSASRSSSNLVFANLCMIYITILTSLIYACLWLVAPRALQQNA